MAAKLNQIPRILPEGWIASARWLGEHGYTRSQLAQYKEKGHWLESPVRGAYVRPGTKLRWQHVVVSLQRLEQLPLHVGGRTALVHRGLAHYLSFGGPETIHLYGPVGLPAWARKLQLPERLKTHSDAMFGSLPRVWRDKTGQILGDHGTLPRLVVLEQSCLTDFAWEHWDWNITYSTEERAIFEVLQDVPKRESIYEADVLIAGLVNLRPARLQALLSHCASVKVKRLFLALAERHRHAWFTKLDLEKVDVGVRQVQLLVRILPIVARETCFALKGGTAINLFLRDLPRLSVDIDLAFLPITNYPTARRQISEALNRMREQLTSGSPAHQVVAGSNDGSGAIDTLNVSTGREQVKIEVNPVLRGSFEEPQTVRIRPAAEDAFGFAEIMALSFNDIYGGKLMAAIDRQHPRDLFDVKLLFENEGVTDELFRALLVYLIGHKGSLADSLDPRLKDIRRLFEQQFVGMTAQPVSLNELLDVREKLISEIRSRIGDREKHFLLSLKKCEPDWESIGLTHAQDLPAVKWKLLNLSKMPKADHEKAVARLQKTLDAI